MRVVSLVPSVTETLLAWGIAPVAVTRFCEQPTLESVGGTKDPDVARIAELAPDLVVVEREENRRQDAEALVGAGLRLHVLHVRALEDVAPAMAGLRAAIGADPVAAPSLRAPRQPWCRAFVPIWRRPWMGLGDGTYGSSVLDRLGVANVLAGLGAYPTVSLDDVAALRPDVVLAPSEPYPFAERHRAELERVAPVRFLDGRDLFWWGARTPAALDRLAQVIAPEN